MTFVIDIEPVSAFFTQKTTLDGKDYVLSFAWNQRESRWYLTIYDHEDNVLQGAVKVIADFPLTRRIASSDTAPPGVLMAVDLTDAGDPPTRDDLGSRVILVYYDAETVAAAVA